MTKPLLKNPSISNWSPPGCPELFNIRVRSANRKLDVLENLDDDKMSDYMARRLKAYDLQEAAEAVNKVVRQANRQWDTDPKPCVEFMRQFVNALDHDELAEAAGHVFEDLKGELRPVARAVVPGLVNWVCDVLQPTDDEYEEEAARARSALNALLTPEEM